MKFSEKVVTEEVRELRKEFFYLNDFLINIKQDTIYRINIPIKIKIKFLALVMTWMNLSKKVGQ